MRRLSLAVLPLCLSLAACAPEDRSASTSAPPAAPSTPVVDVATPAPAPATADEHAHHHDASAGEALQRPPGGGNWATDAALRQGMEAIHVALAAALPAFEKGELDAPAATNLASVVTSQVQFLLANCKLEPDADAQLHILIGQMMSAAEAMVADAGSVDGVPKLHEAVQLYGDYFEHPGLHDHSGAPHHADGEHAHADDAAAPAKD
jgi:hypothetical protein